jgi:hypothetical protein
VPTTDYHPGATTEQKLEQRERRIWAEIAVEKNRHPEKDILDLVREQFGVTARHSFERLQEHEEEMRRNYADEERFAHTMENTARVIESGSRVALFVGGALIAAPAAAGAGAAAQIAAGTGTFVSGIDVALQVGETTSILVRGTSKLPPELQRFKDNKAVKAVLLIANAKEAFSPRNAKELATVMFAIKDTGSSLQEIFSTDGGVLKFEGDETYEYFAYQGVDYEKFAQTEQALIGRFMRERGLSSRGSGSPLEGVIGSPDSEATPGEDSSKPPEPTAPPAEPPAAFGDSGDDEAPSAATSWDVCDPFGMSTGDYRACMREICPTMPGDEFCEGEDFGGGSSEESNGEGECELVIDGLCYDDCGAYNDAGECVK